MIEGVVLYVEYEDGYNCHLTDTELSRAVDRAYEGVTEHGYVTVCIPDRFWEVVA